MKESHSLSLIVAYYLSKFNDSAYMTLGFGTKTETHRQIGKILDVKSATVKNMRDEFDPLHENERAGWYQRELRPSRQRTVEACQSLLEEELRDLVLEILENKNLLNNEVLIPFLDSLNEEKTEPIFIPRGITGRKAEKAFVNFFELNQLPLKGILVDKRDFGCGYDYEIIGENQSAFVEIKGLDGEQGGISFTSKEWDVANKMGSNYYLVIVKNVSTSPNIEIIENPASKLNPKKYIFSTVQIKWNVAIV